MNTIVGMAGVEECAKQIGFSLNSMQQRGFSGAGILSRDESAFYLRKNIGSLQEVFDGTSLDSLLGDVAIGSVQLLAQDNLQVHELEPFLSRFPFEVGLVFEGAISNEKYLRDQLMQSGVFGCVSSAHSELVLAWLVHGFQSPDLNFENLRSSVALFQSVAQGSFCAVGILPNSNLFGFRSTFGTRPLILGSKKERDLTAYILIGDVKICELQGYTVEREIQPGELICLERFLSPETHNLEWAVRTARLGP